MVIISLISLIFFIILTSYFLFLIKKQNKKINIFKKTITYLIKSQATENKLYLLDEIDNKNKKNKDLIVREFQKYNTESKKYIDNLHQELISNEFKKLKLDVNKDLNDIVESVKNVKIF